MNGNEPWSFAASTAFSLFGLLYVAIPVIVLLGAAWFAARTSRHLFWAIVCGGTAAVVGLFSAIAGLATVAGLSGEGPLFIDRYLPVAANLGACLGAAVGVAAFAGVRAATYALRRRGSGASNPGPTP